MSWEQLEAILKQNRDYARVNRSAKPRTCPNDGSQLTQGRRGVLDCPFGDYRWPAFARS
jgi:hypothetical protein